MGSFVRGDWDNLIDRQSFCEDREAAGDWRDRLSYILAVAALFSGIPFMIYGGFLYYRTGWAAHGMVPLLLEALVGTVIWNKRIAAGRKKQLLIWAVYAGTLFHTFTAGIMGSMVVAAFTLFLAGLLLDKKQLRRFWLLNYAVFLVIALLLYLNRGPYLDAGILDTGNAYIGAPDYTGGGQYKEIWIVCAAVMQACSLMLLLPARGIYNHLDRQFRLAEEEKVRLKALIENSTDMALISDETGRVLYYSSNLYDRFPWISGTLLGSNFIDELYLENPEHLWSVFHELREKSGRRVTEEVRYRHRERYGYLELTAVNLLQDTAVQGILIYCRDITRRREQEEEIRYLSQHDYLTGLYNRAFYERELERLERTQTLPLSVIVGDVNGLKMINDSLGHDEGDKLLVSIANILKKCCRDGDIIARLGGDEFNILLPGTDKEEAIEIIHRICNTCEEYNEKLAGEVYHISISLGAASRTEKKQSMDSVIKQAEDYMYKRKLLEGRSFHSSIIASMKTVLYEKCFENEEHAGRLLHLTRMVGEELGLTRQQSDELELLSTIHDIGMIGIDDHILNKPGKLTREEWEKMQKHSEIGYRIAMASPGLMSIAYPILTHHEHWDGGGYPQGLTGDRIPLLSRILAVADAYEAMTQDRPYRRAISGEEAIFEIIDKAGTQFDPKIARVFAEKMSNDFLGKSEQAVIDITSGKC